DTKNEDTEEQTSLVKKINAQQDWVYDRDSDEYYPLPYINIDSKDARRINEEIEDVLEEEKAFVFDNDLFELDYWEYVYFIHDDILSVVMQIHLSKMDEIVSTKIYTANLDLKDGKELSMEDLLKRKGMAKNGLTLMERALLNEVRVHLGEVDEFTEKEYEGWALQELYLNYKEQKLPFYINEKGTFAFYAHLMDGTYTPPLRAIPIEPDETVPAHDMYEGLGRYKIKPETMALGGFLGYGANDEARAIMALTKAKSFLEDVQIDDLPYLQILYPIKEGRLMDEMHFILPVYKNAVTIVKFVDFLSETPTEDNFVTVNRGPLVELCNVSEIAPNVEITILYRDKEITYSPGISLKDGSNVLPPEIIDITDELYESPNMELRDAYIENLR
ncbi:MAG: hypothetical protein Q4Q17_05460, partial [Tissierellia bacterium]|nr:hypothetical protein [Tissierellia bacterium]